MKKRIYVCLVLILSLCGVFAAAEEKNSLSDFSSRLQKSTAQMETDTAGNPGENDGLSYGPALRIDDPFFEKIRSSAYLTEDKYSREANVMIELKNISGRTLYPGKASISAYNAAGELIEEETYSSCGPEMVANGESMYVWEWFYGLDVPVSEISYFEVKVETETSSYRNYEKIEGQALVSDGVAYALIENTTDNDIYGLSATIAIENENGTLLDVCNISTGNACGIFPGSVMILRDNAQDYANDTYLAEGTATVSALYQLD